MAEMKLSRVPKFVRPYCVTDGRKFRLKEWDPGDTGGLKEDKKNAKELLATGVKLLADLQDKLYAQDRWCASPDLPGDGRRREGRDDQARHVGREPAGVPGLLVQVALGRGARPRLPLADDEVPSRAGADRHLQPVVLRGGPCRPGPSRVPREAEAPAEARDEGHLEGAVREHRRTSRSTSPGTGWSS